MKSLSIMKKNQKWKNLSCRKKSKSR